MDNMISTLDEGHCSLIEQILILLTKNVFSLKLDEWFWRESKKREKFTDRCTNRQRRPMKFWFRWAKNVQIKCSLITLFQQWILFIVKNAFLVTQSEVLNTFYLYSTILYLKSAFHNTLNTCISTLKTERYYLPKHSKFEFYYTV